MQRFLILLFILFFICNSLFANPFYTTDMQVSGIGVLEFDADVILFKTKDETSTPLLKLTISETKSNLSIMNAPQKSHEYFLARTSDRQKAFLTVTDETADGWFEVCYSQKQNLKAWVKADSNQFKTWREFQLFWGRKNNVFFFKDVPPEERKLYAQPFEKPEDKRLVDGYSHANKIKPVIIKGNWMLVRVLDILNKEKIGYVRWRNNDGQVLIFPYL